MICLEREIDAERGPEEAKRTYLLYSRHRSSCRMINRLAFVALASVNYLFRVVLFPLEGLPTSPIRGSRGISDYQFL